MRAMCLRTPTQREKRPREDGAGAAGGMDEIAEANALRAKLGLKPLRS